MMIKTREVGKEALPLFLGRLISYSLNFFIGLILARILGPTSFGIISLAMSLLLLFFTLNNLGIDFSLPYFISKAMIKKNYQKAKEILKQGLTIRLISAITASILFFILSDYFATFYGIPELSYICKVFSIAVLTYSIIYLFPIIYQSFKKFKYALYQDVILSIFKLSIIPLTIIFGLSGTVYGYVISFSLTLIFGFYFVKKITPKVNSKKQPYTKIIKYSLTSFSGILIGYFSVNIGNLLIGYLPEQVAFLSIAQKISAVLLLPAGSFVSALFPNISRITNLDSIKIAFKAITKYTILISGFLIFFLISISLELIQLLLTDSYLPGLNIIRLIVLGIFLKGISMPFQSFFLGTNNPGIVTKSNTIQGVISVSLIIILISNYQAIGVSIAILISYLINFLYLLMKAKKIKCDYPIGYLIKTLICCAVSSLIIFLKISDPISSLLIKIVLFNVLFLISGSMLKVITNKELKLIKDGYKYLIRRLRS